LKDLQDSHSVEKVLAIAAQAAKVGSIDSWKNSLDTAASDWGLMQDLIADKDAWDQIDIHPSHKAQIKKYMTAAGSTAGGQRQETEEYILNIIDRRVSQLKLQMAKRSGSTTFTEHWEEVKEKGQVVSLWLDNRTPVKGKCWTEEPPTGAHEDPYQSFMSAQLSTLCAAQFCQYKFEDTHDNPYLDERKPDLSFFPKQEDYLSITNVAILGELKPAWNKPTTSQGLGKKKTDFSNDAKGQIITFAERLLDVQPFRGEVTVFLCDCYHIQFFKVARNSVAGGYTYVWTQRQPLFKKKRVAFRRGRRNVVVLEPLSGFNNLLSLLATPPQRLGLTNIPRYCGESLPLTTFLGKGATSCVYGSIRGTVLKVVEEKYASLVPREVEVLNFLNSEPSIRPSVPQVLNSSGNMIQMKPQGEPLSSGFTLSECTSIVLVLKKLHEGWVHRDIRPDNFLRAMTTLFMTDFGFAVPVGVEQAYCGTTHYASSRILELLAAGTTSFVCTPADDLVSFVYCLFAFSQPAFRNTLAAIPNKDYQQITTCWAAFHRLSSWQPMYQAALDGDYDGLGTVAQNLFL